MCWKKAPLSLLPYAQAFFPPPQPLPHTPLPPQANSIAHLFFCEAVFLSKHVWISQFSSLGGKKRLFSNCSPSGPAFGKNPCSSFLLTGCLQSAAWEKQGHRDLQAWKSQGPGSNSHSVSRQVGALEFYVHSHLRALVRGKCVHLDLGPGTMSEHQSQPIHSLSNSFIF